MLWKFAQDHTDDVESVYFVCGTLADSSSDAIKLVPGTKLEETKKLFSKLSSVHVHSLFKKVTSKSAELVRP
jgi:restriction endonuclease